MAVHRTGASGCLNDDGRGGAHGLGVVAQVWSGATVSTMPTYTYACGETQVDAVRTIDERDDAPTCPDCGAPMRRKLTAAPAIFKGPGFYSTSSQLR